MKKYKVKDIYDGSIETLGYCETMGEVRKLAKERDKDTDGEFDVWYLTLNEKTGKYNNPTHLDTY